MADLESLRIRVPKSQISGLQRLIGLTDIEVSKLRAELEHAAPSMVAGGIVNQIKGSVDIPLSDLTEVVRVLFSLAFSRDRFNLETDEVVADVIKAAQQGKLIGDTTRESESFGSRLHSLLSVRKAIGASSKALDVFLRHKKSFVSARVLTDIRPVFSEDSVPVPLAAMIVHNVELVSHVDDEHTADYIALDTEDLLSLRAVIDRALLKEKALKDAITASGIAYLDALSDD